MSKSWIKIKVKIKIQVQDLVHENILILYLMVQALNGYEKEIS